jgi:hypothetical protein
VNYNNTFCLQIDDIIIIIIESDFQTKTLRRSLSYIYLLKKNTIVKKSEKKYEIFLREISTFIVIGIMKNYGSEMMPSRMLLLSFIFITGAFQF